MRNLRCKASFQSRKTAIALTPKYPSLNQSDSAGGSLRWISKMRPSMRPFLAGLGAFFGNKNVFFKTGRNLPNMNLEYGVILQNTGPPLLPS